MMLDATQNFDQPLTKERLFGWHTNLLPNGKSGMYEIEVGKWRTNEMEPMQVVNGAMGREHAHFQAPMDARLEYEMDNFIGWFYQADALDRY